MKCTSVFAFAAVLLAATASFAATTVSVGNSSLSGISNDGSQGNQYDILSIAGQTTTFNAVPGMGVIDLGTLTFTDANPSAQRKRTAWPGCPFSFCSDDAELLLAKC